MNKFKFYTPENSQGDAKEILTQVNKKYGFVPNLFGYMAEAPYTIEAYTMLNELIEKTGLTAAQRQVALLTVSHYNNCDFCRVAHRAFGKMNAAKAQTIAAIIGNETIEDETDRAMVDMVIAITDQRGWLEQTQIDNFIAAGFSQRNIYDLILIVTIKTLSNYSNHLTKPEANEQFVSML